MQLNGEKFVYDGEVHVLGFTLTKDGAALTADDYEPAAEESVNHGNQFLNNIGLQKRK